jgi:hypothetical protein
MSPGRIRRAAAEACTRRCKTFVRPDRSCRRSLPCCFRSCRPRRRCPHPRWHRSRRFRLNRGFPQSLGSRATRRRLRTRRPACRRRHREQPCWGSPGCNRRRYRRASCTRRGVRRTAPMTSPDSRFPTSRQTPHTTMLAKNWAPRRQARFLDDPARFPRRPRRGCRCSITYYRLGSVPVCDEEN